MPNGKGEMVTLSPDSCLVHCFTCTVHAFVLAGMTSPPPNRKVDPLASGGSALRHDGQCVGKPSF